MITQREAFEAWAKNQSLPLEPWVAVPHEYRDSNTCDAWLAWQAAQAAMPAELAQLRGFVADVMGAWPEEGIDAADLQEIAAAHGLLTLKVVHQSCGDVCQCAELLSDEQFAAGVECYRKSRLLLDAAKVAP